MMAEHRGPVQCRPSVPGQSAPRRLEPRSLEATSKLTSVSQPWKLRVDGTGEHSGKSVDLCSAGGFVACQHVFDGSAEPMKSEGTMRVIGSGRQPILLPRPTCDFVLDMYPS